MGFGCSLSFEREEKREELKRLKMGALHVPMFLGFYVGKTCLIYIFIY